VLTGIVVGAVSLFPHFFLHDDVSLALAAVLLGIVAGVYFGFAVVNGDNREQMIEFNMASAFGIAALLGLVISPWFIPAAYAAHALWDLAHHNKSNMKLVAIPQWYIPWCIVIDLIIAIGLILIWTKSGVL